MILNKKVTIECNVKIESKDSTHLIRIPDAVDSSGKPIYAYKLKKGICNFLVVINSKGEIFSKETILSFLIKERENHVSLGYNFVIELKMAGYVTISWYDNFPRANTEIVALNVMTELEELLK